MPDYKIAIFFSGLERSLQNSTYNACVDECKAASYELKSFSGRPYKKYADTRLRDVPHTVYYQYGAKLPLNWKKRAEHFYTELTEPKLAPKPGAGVIWLNMDG